MQLYSDWNSELVSFLSQIAKLLTEAWPLVFGIAASFPRVSELNVERGAPRVPLSTVPRSIRHSSPSEGCHEHAIQCQVCNENETETRHWFLSWNTISSTLLVSIRSKSKIGRALFKKIQNLFTTLRCWLWSTCSRLGSKYIIVNVTTSYKKSMHHIFHEGSCG
jgi:hypothetical protein